MRSPQPWRNPVFCALDMPDAASAAALARRLAPWVGGIKLGLEFFCAAGPDGVRRVADVCNLPIFLDLKLHDIPNTVAGAVRSLAELDCAIMTLHAQGSRAMLAAAAEAAQVAAGRKVGAVPRLVAVTVLTSLDDGDLAETGHHLQPAELAERLALLAREAGLDGIVCSAHEVSPIRALWPEALRVVPGIRPAGGESGDQKRVMTPREALDAGASILVIGRPITASRDPEGAAASIVSSLT